MRSSHGSSPEMLVNAKVFTLYPRNRNVPVVWPGPRYVLRGSSSSFYPGNGVFTYGLVDGALVRKRSGGKE